MHILLPLILFIVGFYILIKGANILIRGTTSIARIFKLSPWFIGVVIIGIGTSIPEFAINIASVFSGNSIGFATIIGSTIFNVLGIIGLCAILIPLKFHREWIIRDLPIGLFAISISTFFMYVPIFGYEHTYGISRIEGALLIGILIVWILFMLRRKDKGPYPADTEAFSWFASFTLIVAGFVGVFLGGKWVVDGATTIALLAGVSPALVGFTAVAIGTSAPELVISLVAVYKRQTSIAIGNIIGSNIFNFFGIFGITALLHPIPAVSALSFDIFVAIAATFLLVPATFLGKKKLTISRGEGIFFVSMYIAYLVFLFVRG